MVHCADHRPFGTRTRSRQGHGAHAGADDYLTKPFGIGELLARLRVALRHASTSNVPSSADPIFQVGGLRLDHSRREVTVDGQPIHLTPTEYRLLTFLARNAGKVVTHRQLLKEVWGPDSVSENQYLRVYMGSSVARSNRMPHGPGIYALKPESVIG